MVSGTAISTNSAVASPAYFAWTYWARADRPREVQRRDPEAQVARDRGRRLRADEDDDRDLEREDVLGVAERQRRQPEVAGHDAHHDRRDRQHGQQQERHHLRPRRPAEAERAAERVDVERPADVPSVRVAGRRSGGSRCRGSHRGLAHENTSTIRCRCRSMRTRPSPSSAHASRTRSYVASSVTSTSSSRPVARDGRPCLGQPGQQRGRVVVDLDGDDRGLGRHGGGRGVPQQPAAVDDHDPVADALELAEQVGGDQDRDAELAADPPDQVEHVVAAGGVETVGGLVEQHQLGVVDQRLRELDPLLHAGGVAAHRPVALLVEPDVAQDVGRPLAGGGRRQPRHPGHVDAELGGGHVGRQAVVLGHVADPLADRRALGARRRGRARGRSPRSRSSSPSRILSRVDLPAPFAPTSPVTPGSTSTVRSARAVTPPAYRWVREVVVIIPAPTRAGHRAGSPARRTLPRAY